MLLRKLSFSEKVKRVLPERLESFANRSKDKEEDVGTLDLGFELVEDPIALRLNEFGSETEIVDDEDRRELDSTTDQRVGKDILKQVSASTVIAAEDKRSDLEFELSQEVINLERLQQISSTGLPDGGGLRSLAWKLLLGYLSTSRDLWEGQLADNRLKYAKLNEELLFNPSEIMRRKDETWVVSRLEKHRASDVLLKRHDISLADHPLSVGRASIWHQYFQDSDIAEQIDRDLQRTHPDIKFFSADSSFSCKHQQAMRNILLLFAKLNPAIRYVQGMNEVLAPLYFVFSTDPYEQNCLNAEADTFACFVRLLSGSVDHFCQQLDNSAVGILCTLSRLMELLKTNDEELWQHLEISNKVNPQFYAFRWITLLLTQEFKFTAIMRIWDSLLSNPDGVQDMLLRVCCAMLLCVRTKLLDGDFAANLKLLQHYPESNIDYLLKVAQELKPIQSTLLSPV